ncbi:MAG: hypothetical protein IPG89_15405 [Bacteroidetes bacterium]|nr:hypothetical protein [Bacteroidota bacterium]
MKKAITLTIFSMFILAGCMRQDIYDYYIPLQEISFNIYKQDKNCNHLLYKSINMEISHESLDLEQLKKYKLLISFDGIVYNGGFRSNIKLNDLPICKSEGRNFVSIVVCLQDKLRTRHIYGKMIVLMQ